MKRLRQIHPVVLPHSALMVQEKLFIQRYRTLRNCLDRMLIGWLGSGIAPLERQAGQIRRGALTSGDEMLNCGFVASHFACSSGKHEAYREEDQLGQGFRIRPCQGVGVFQFRDDLIRGQTPKQRKLRGGEHKLPVSGNRKRAADVATFEQATEFFEIETIEWGKTPARRSAGKAGYGAPKDRQAVSEWPIGALERGSDFLHA